MWTEWGEDRKEGEGCLEQGELIQIDNVHSLRKGVQEEINWEDRAIRGNHFIIIIIFYFFNTFLKLCIKINKDP